MNPQRMLYQQQKPFRPAWLQPTPMLCIGIFSAAGFGSWEISPSSRAPIELAPNRSGSSEGRDGLSDKYTRAREVGYLSNCDAKPSSAPG